MGDDHIRPSPVVVRGAAVYRGVDIHQHPGNAPSRISSIGGGGDAKTARRGPMPAYVLAHVDEILDPVGLQQ
jgi:hypothetical protein